MYQFVFSSEVGDTVTQELCVYLCVGVRQGEIEERIHVTELKQLQLLHLTTKSSFITKWYEIAVATAVSAL